MKAQYDSSPSLIQKLQGGILINFNIKQVTVEKMSGQSTSFECEQVKVSQNPDKGEIASAIIRSKYSTSDELALIHNGTDTETHSSELNEFTEFRSEAKRIANEVIAAL